MSSIYEKYLTALTDEQLVIDCPKMLLKPYLEQTQGRTYEGSGSIFQVENGRLTFKLYVSEVDSLFELFPSLDIDTIGRVIEDSSYYNLTAFDINGREWISKKIYIEKTNGRSGSVITGKLRSIKTTKYNLQFLNILVLWWKWYIKKQNDRNLKPETNDLWIISFAYLFLKESSLSLWFWGDIKLPFNTQSSAITTVGNRVRRIKTDINISEFSAHGFKFELN